MTDQKNGMSKADKMLADAQQAKLDESIDQIVQPLIDNTVRGAIVGMQAIRFDHVLRAVARCSARSVANFFGGPDTPEANKVVRDFRNQARIEFARTLHETPLSRPAPPPQQQQQEQAQPAAPADQATSEAAAAAPAGDVLDEIAQAIKPDAAAPAQPDNAAEAQTT